MYIRVQGFIPVLKVSRRSSSEQDRAAQSWCPPHLVQVLPNEAAAAADAGVHDFKGRGTECELGVVLDAGDTTGVQGLLRLRGKSSGFDCEHRSGFEGGASLVYTELSPTRVAFVSGKNVVDTAGAFRMLQLRGTKFRV